MSSTPAKQEETKQTISEPWKPAQGTLQTILSQVGGINPNGTAAEMGALDRLAGRAASGNSFAPAIGGVATQLLGGGPDRTGIVNDAYSQYRATLDPTARGDYLDPTKNPFFSATSSAIGDDVISRLQTMYGNAGRSPTGAGSLPTEVGKGVATALAPTFANVWNQERDRQLGAGGNLFNAGTTTAGTLSGLDQTRFGNMQAGIGAAGSALDAGNYGDMQTLAIEAQRRGIPLGTLAQMAGITTPIAGLGGQSSSTGTTTSEPAFNPWQTALGVGIAGAGLMSGNPMMVTGGLGQAGQGSGLFGAPQQASPFGSWSSNYRR